ncbi:unnamed protein product, partial [Ixodes pacificus]
RQGPVHETAGDGVGRGEYHLAGGCHFHSSSKACRAYDRELCLLHEELPHCAVTWEVTMHLTMASITWISCWTEEQPGRPALFKPVASSSERRCDIWTECIQSVGKLINHFIL